MNHDEAEELLGAYALDALPDAEAAAVRAHLETCPEHAAQARELREVAMRLSWAPEAVAPPAQLRTRLLDAIAREPQEAAPAESAAAPSVTRMPASRGNATRTRSNIRRFPVAWGSLAAALLLVAGGLFAWNIVLQNRLDDRLDASNATAVRPLQPASAGQQSNAYVLFFTGDKKAVVVGEGITPAAPGKTYQMWAIRDGAPVSIGLMQPDADGRVHAVVDFDAVAADTLAITIEPAGGSAQPTSAPVLTAKV